MILSDTKKAASATKESGFALLFAVLLSSVLISLGLSIFNISLKEIDIATSARDSAQAYYAADSARECAIYWDIVKGAIPACIDQSTADCGINVAATQITCAGNTVNVDLSGSTDPASLNFVESGLGYFSQNPMVNFFKFSSNPLDPASDIYISKIYNATNGTVDTTIETFGHNSQIAGRRVERGMSFSYIQ